MTIERARVLDLVVRDLPPGTAIAGPTVACGRGAVELVRVRPAGRKSMAASDWWRGLRAAGGRFGSS
jgi:methionyl-tRNA formyltransferase